MGLGHPREELRTTSTVEKEAGSTRVSSAGFPQEGVPELWPKRLLRTSHGLRAPDGGAQNDRHTVE